MEKILISAGFIIMGISVVVVGAYVHVGPIFGTFILGIIILLLGAIKKEMHD